MQRRIQIVVAAGLTLLCSSGACLPPIECPDGSEEHAGRCYLAVEDSTSAWNASDRCEALGGRLAEDVSAEALAFYSGMAGGSAWVGVKGGVPAAARAGLPCRYVSSDGRLGYMTCWSLVPPQYPEGYVCEVPGE